MSAAFIPAGGLAHFSERLALQSNRVVLDESSRSSVCRRQGKERLHAGVLGKSASLGTVKFLVVLSTLSFIPSCLVLSFQAVG